MPVGKSPNGLVQNPVLRYPQTLAEVDIPNGEWVLETVLAEDPRPVVGQPSGDSSTVVKPVDDDPGTAFMREEASDSFDLHAKGGIQRWHTSGGSRTERFLGVTAATVGAGALAFSGIWFFGETVGQGMAQLGNDEGESGPSYVFISPYVAAAGALLFGWGLYLAADGNGQADRED
jgi:hypothetical protein